MKYKVNELSGAALDWAVAKCEGRKEPDVVNNFSVAWYTWRNTHYSTNWQIGGPIIEREKIAVVCCEGDYNPGKKDTHDCYDTYWVAEIGRQNAEDVYGPQGDNWGECFQIDVNAMQGPTPLIAAMRCYVASKLGEYVEVPDGL